MHQDGVIRGRDLQYTLAELRIAKGYNQTWYATAPTEIQFYVLKFIRYLPVHQKKAERLMKTLGGLDDKNIMIIYESFLYEQEGMKYLVVVSEFYKQGSLLRRIRSRQWEYDHKAQCMFHAACGLQYLHGKNIMHRNIKPENIFRWDKIAKLGDLGVAKELDGSHMTSGVTGYIHMAPEMYERDEYGMEADIWSLGIVFMEVVLSRELNHIHNWRDSPSQEYDVLSQQLHRLPGTLAKLVGGMLQVDRQKRVKIDHVVQVMAKVVGLDLGKYRELPLEHFKKKERKPKKKKEEPIINSKEDLIKYYNNGAPIFPDMPEDFDKNKLIPKFQDIELPEITDQEIEREMEEARKNPKPKPDPSKNPQGRIGPMGMGGMKDMMGMMGMNRLMGMGGGMGGDMMGNFGGLSDMMGGGGMGGMGGGRGTGGMGAIGGEFKGPKMTNDFAGDLLKNLNNPNKTVPPSIPIQKEVPKQAPSPKVEERPKTATITVKAPSQSQKITKPQVSLQPPPLPPSPQKVFKKKNVVYPEEGKQTKIKVNSKPNNQQSERVKVIDNQEDEKKPKEAEKVKVKKKKKEDGSQNNGTDSEPQAKNQDLKPKKKKKPSETLDLQQKKPQKQKQIEIKPQKPKSKKKQDPSFQSGADSDADKQISLKKEQKKKKKKFQSDEQVMLTEDPKPKKKKEQPKDRADESSGQNGQKKVKKEKKIETSTAGPKIETPSHVPQASTISFDDRPLKITRPDPFPPSPSVEISLQEKPDFRQKQVENNLPSSYIGSDKSTSDRQSEKGKKKPRKKFGFKEPEPVVEQPKQDFEKLAKIHEEAVAHSYKEAQRKFGINFAKKQEEMRQNQANSQREREERERVQAEQRKRENDKLRMKKRADRRREREDLGLPPLDEEMEEYMEQEEFGKLKRGDYGTREHPYRPQQTSIPMQEEEMEIPGNHYPSSALQMARPSPGGFPRHQSQGPPPPPRPQFTIDQLVEEIYILESKGPSCEEIASKYIQLAKLYSQTHLYKKAIEVLASALRNLDVIDEVVSERVAEIHFQLGNAYLNTDSPETAHQSLTMARQTRASLGIPESEQDIAILNSLGVAFRTLGQVEQAKRCYEQAVKKAHQAQRNPLSLVNPLSNLAGIIQGEGDNQGALKILKQAQKLLKESQNTGQGPYSGISENIIQLLFGMRNYGEGLREINLLFRLFIDNRRTVEAEYYRFRERALKHMISAMSKSKVREELIRIEGLLTEYYEDQTKVAEKLREILYSDTGHIDQMEGLD